MEPALTVVVPSFYGEAAYHVAEDVEVEGGVHYRFLVLKYETYYDDPPQGRFEDFLLYPAEELGYG